MIVDVVDHRDQPVGVIARREVFIAKAGFRVAHVFIFNSSGELLLQQVAPTRKRFPLCWGSSVAAYLFAAETYVDAARRRLEQELGLRAGKFEFRLKATMLDHGCEKFISLFETSHDGPFSIDNTHIQAIEFVLPWKIDQAILDGSRLFTPTFAYLWKRYRTDRGAQP